MYIYPSYICLRVCVCACVCVYASTRTYATTPPRTQRTQDVCQVSKTKRSRTPQQHFDTRKSLYWHRICSLNQLVSGALCRQTIERVHTLWPLCWGSQETVPLYSGQSHLRDPGSVCVCVCVFVCVCVCPVYRSPWHTADTMVEVCVVEIFKSR